MKAIRYFGLSLLSSFLLFAAWPVIGFSFLIFFAFIPLLWLEDKITAQQIPRGAWLVFGYSYLTFFCWNVFTTWWIYNASAGGAVMAIVANALLMAIVFTAFYKVKKRTNSGYLSLICFWIAFEYLHLNWDLSWPWLTLGNVFSINYKWVQWYEFTGVLGGSLWVLVVNILGYRLWCLYAVNKSNIRFQKLHAQFIGALFLPIVISYTMYARGNSERGGNETGVVIVQPNIDPYNEKFTGMSDEDQLLKLLQLAEPKIDSSTKYLIAPETAIASNIWENKIEEAPQILLLQNFLKKYPHLTLVIGASTTKAYVDGALPSATARKLMRQDIFYDSYNTALQIDSSKQIQLYHKSKLVPGVEKIPFPVLFKPFEKFAIDLGGTSGSLGVQDTRTVFQNSNKQIQIAPIICYESIYGAFVGDYVKNGAQLLFIITNDGWWGDTPGYKQHLSYASLRAIETRREIARSANTGTSAVVNDRGDISLQTPWWEEAVIKTKLTTSNRITFYVKYGDYLGYLASILSGLTVLFYVYSAVKRSKN